MYLLIYVFIYACTHQESLVTLRLSIGAVHISNKWLGFCALGFILALHIGRCMKHSKHSTLQVCYLGVIPSFADQLRSVVSGLVLVYFYQTLYQAQCTDPE